MEGFRNSPSGGHDRHGEADVTGDTVIESIRGRWPDLLDRPIMGFFYLNSTGRPVTLKAFLADFERQLILTAMRVCSGSQKHAAQLLGLQPSTLCEKMKRLEIKISKFELEALRKGRIKAEVDRILPEFKGWSQAESTRRRL